jgi:hypothetical protein
MPEDKQDREEDRQELPVSKRQERPVRARQIRAEDRRDRAEDR